jgi:predicted O-methyltransferase YrrM
MANYTFTEDWFSGNIGVWTEALHDFKGKAGVSMLEIGSFQGRSAVWLLENVLTHATARLDCVDTFEGSVEHTSGQKSNMLDLFTHNVGRFGEKVRVLRGESQYVLRRLAPGPSYDMIYVDGDHHACAVLEDAILAFRLLKPGGLMIFDDYQWKMELPDLERPALGVDAFLTVFADKVKVLYSGYQVIVKKSS